MSISFSMSDMIALADAISRVEGTTLGTPEDVKLINKFYQLEMSYRRYREGSLQLSTVRRYSNEFRQACKDSLGAEHSSFSEL